MFGSKVKVPKELLDKINKYAKIAGYTSADEFVVHALEKEISLIEEGGEDEEEIKKKLQGLGYLS